MRRHAPLFFAILFVGGLTAWLWWRMSVGGAAVAPGKPALDLAAAQRDAAAQLSALLPRQIDDLTTLVSVRADGATLIYAYRLSRPAEALDVQAFLARMRASLTPAVCAQAGMVQVLGLGGGYTYDYVDAGGQPVGTIALRRADCDAR